MNQQLTLDKDDNDILQSLESNAADMVLMVIWTAGYIQIYFTVLIIELDYAWSKSQMDSLTMNFQSNRMII